KALSRTTLRPLGPRVTLTASASVSTPRWMPSRASWSNAMSLAIRCDYPRLLFDDREQVTSGQEKVLFAVVLQLGAAVLGEDDGVALLDVDSDALALLVGAARAHSDDGGLLRLLLGGVRDDQAGSGGGLGLDDLDQDLVL